MVPAKNHTGKRFGRWTALQRVANNGRNVMWLCRCDCGTERSVRASALVFGQSRSCHSCKRFMEKRAEHTIWIKMLSRCYDRRDPAYPRYGGRGIKVCARWRKSFYVFYSDMGLRPPLYTLERINNNGNYKPDNCRWADRRDQANNRRSNRLITYAGRTMTLMQWARETGIKRSTIQMRIDEYGWPVDKALTTATRA